VIGCLACDLTEGRVPLPGGVIHRTGHWRVEHCIGPLGPGTLIVKPRRHITAVADLTSGEAGELGPLLRRASAVARDLVAANQVYNCLWSHADGEPVHIHYVIQPVTKEQMAHFGAHGPSLQAAMFASGAAPGNAEITRLAGIARQAFSQSPE
jgi:diadenosine tetraphosphate (Ap4A) HIT family hydrolase